MKLPVVLDFDGVIAKVDLDWSLVKEKVSLETGIKIDSFTEFFNSNFGSPEYDLVSRALEKYEKSALEAASPYPDVKVVLEAINRPLIIATMQTESVVRSFLKKHELLMYISDILGRNRFGSKKEELIYISKKYGSGIFVDDRPSNCKVARKLGFKAFLLDRRKGKTLKNLLDYFYTISI
ncbi:HAD family hydrolase [Thermococcus sp.]